jgi:D-methionine transport system substrate-binding protein
MVRLALFLAAAAITTACTSPSPPSSSSTLRVGASPVPHAIILEHVRPVLAARGITLEVVELTDYVQPNLALAAHDLDANFFQHQPYLDRFNADRATNLVTVARVHVEPLGLYARVRSLEQLPASGAVVAIPNDPTNSARALRLLQSAGLLRLDPAVTEPTPQHIVDNPRGIVVRELDAAQLPRVLADVDAAVINANYVLEAGLKPDAALVREPPTSNFANVLVVNADATQDPRVLALTEALTSDDTRAFIAARFAGAVVPASR